jgi:hypothetical protein
MGRTIGVLAGTAKALPIGVVYAIGALPGLVDFISERRSHNITTVHKLDGLERRTRNSTASNA